MYTYTTAHLRKEDCLVCGSKDVVFPCAKAQTLEALIEALKADPQVRSERKRRGKTGKRRRGGEKEWRWLACLLA